MRLKLLNKNTPDKKLKESKLMPINNALKNNIDFKLSLPKQNVFVFTCMKKPKDRPLKRKQIVFARRRKSKE